MHILHYAISPTVIRLTSVKTVNIYTLQPILLADKYSLAMEMQLILYDNTPFVP